MTNDPIDSVRQQELQSQIYYAFLEEMSESDRRFCNILNSLSETVLEIDESGKIQFSNSAASSLFGFGSEELCGKSIEMFLPMSASGLPVWQSFDSRIECQIRRRSGELIWCLVCPKPISRGMVSVTIQDIDSQKRERQRRFKLQKKLRKVNKKLQRSNNRKNDVLAMVGHEFRNPLSVMYNALAVFTQKQVTAEQKDDAEKLLNWQMRKLRRYLDDLLDSIRVDSGSLHLNFAPHEIGAIVMRAVKSTQKAYSEKNLNLELIIPQTPITSFVDELRLEQVFENLLTNAAKWSYQGGRVVVHVDQKEGEAIVHVCDNGQGFSADFEPLLFEKYLRENPKSASSGFGIGLSLCKALVELQGGTISGHSNGPGSGAEFVIKLPLCQSELRNDPAPSPKDDSRRSSAKTASKNSSVKRIAIVDDYPAAAESLAVLLRIRGYEVFTVNDGVEAIKRIKALPPALAFIDIGLPGMDGFDVARCVRREVQDHKIVLVALSGLGGSVELRNGVQSGFDRYLVKPIERQQLDDVLELIE